MDKNYILAEIKKTAEENGGKPLGIKRFYKETGIKESDWSGKYWVRWNDAVNEAGYKPNSKQGAYDDEWLLEKIIGLIRELGKFPTRRELRMEARKDSKFPSESPLRKFGGNAELSAKIIEYCEGKQDGYDDVIKLCAPICKEEETRNVKSDGDVVIGFVYLFKSGRFYKIGRSNSAGRREYELAIQLPEKLKTIHTIRTDDPAGIESYWHNRFKDKRKNGEWFELTSADIAAFQRRKFM